MKFRAERKTCWIDWRRTTCLATVHGPTGRLLCSGNGLRTEESPSRRSFGFERLAPHIAGAQERTRTREIYLVNSKVYKAVRASYPPDYPLTMACLNAYFFGRTAAGNKNTSAAVRTRSSKCVFVGLARSDALAPIVLKHGLLVSPVARIWMHYLFPPASRIWT